MISTLEPRPGRVFAEEEPIYITPDIFVHKLGDEYHVVLNEDGMPKLKVSTAYRHVMANKDPEGKETREFNGQTYLMETGLTGELAIVKAWKADMSGNLLFRKTARNFNPPMATAGQTCVVEAEHLVETGALDPDNIHLPGIYVDRVFLGENFEKRIERRTVREQ